MTDAWIKRLTAAVVLLVAAVAGTISFNHISDLAHAHGQGIFASLLLPVSVDAAIVASSLVMVSAARQRLRTPPLARVMLVLSVGATVGANLAYGLPYGTLGGVISCWPAVSFIGCAELALVMVRSSKRSGQTDDDPMRRVHSTFAQHIAARTTPSIREIKKAMTCSQDRAVKVQQYLTLLSES